MFIRGSETNLGVDDMKHVILAVIGRLTNNSFDKTVNTYLYFYFAIILVLMMIRKNVVRTVYTLIR